MFLSPDSFLVIVECCVFVGLVLRFLFCILAPGVFFAPVVFCSCVSCLLVVVGLCCNVLVPL